MSKTVIVLFTLAFALCGQTLKPGPQVVTFFSSIDDSDQPYGLYIPPSFDAGQKYPLVISLHGAWSNHRLNLRRVFGQGNRSGESDAEATRYFPPFKDVPFFVASPLARGTLGYQGIPEADVHDVLADVRRRFPIDEDRIYLTGLSMGGGGTVWIGATRPDIWAAIAPVCPATPSDASTFEANLLNVPVRLFQGGADPVVKPDGTRALHSRLKELGTAVEYIEYPGVLHNSWDKAYTGGAIFDWFSQHKRNRFPDRVRFATDRYRYSGAYWVRIDRLTPGVPARIDARVENGNRVAITVQGASAFTLALAGHPRVAARKPVLAIVNGKTIRVANVSAASFRSDGGVWKQGQAGPAPSEKRTGLEGPLFDAISSRHIYVYGTGGNPDEAEISARRDIAAKAAEWSTPQLRLLLTHEVKADQDVRESDIAGANLVLFGTAATNRLIARFSPQLPVSLNPGAADYGLVYVYPAGQRYLVINSGLPWWTGAGMLPRQSRRPVPPALMLREFADFVLFRGGIQNILAGGRFGPHWRLSSADSVRLKESGVVEVR